MVLGSLDMPGKPPGGGVEKAAGCVDLGPGGMFVESGDKDAYVKAISMWVGLRP